jgi:signal transduction histidine kinase
MGSRALSVTDNGEVRHQPEQSKGMGLRIMNYRACMIGGSLESLGAMTRAPCHLHFGRDL